MAAFLAALAPVFVLLLGAVRVPTLRRRIQTHTAMLKDIPADIAHPLRQVLADEIATYANLERKRLASQATVWAGRFRMALRVATASLISSGVLAVFGFTWYGSEPPRPLLTIVWVLIGLSYVATTVAYTARNLAARGQSATHNHVPEG